MKDTEILIKAIEKASKFGDLIVMSSNQKELDNLLKDKAYYGLIFSHKFAIGLWGETPTETSNNMEALANYQPAWIHHLQLMVREEEPLKYIAKFI